MSTFKKFACFCGGIALFCACFFLFREFMSFSPVEPVSLREKWEMVFVDGLAGRDYRPYLGLIATLLLSLLVSGLLKEWPAIGLAASALPFLQALFMLRDDLLYERPMLYLLLSALPIIGNLWDALQRDAEDGRHRAFWMANASALLALGFFILLLWRQEAVAEAADVYELSRFDQALFFAAESAPLVLWRNLALTYAALIAVSLALRGAYWLDLLLSVLPIFPILQRQIAGTLGPHSELTLALVFVCAVCRLAVMIAGTPWKECKRESALRRDGFDV